ncbi:MAG: efflux RND transporter periplasmic adaptor subunit [Magnetococcales bacterium]|nr:efflux RND transporter periplasmic adaptor subunit [Magnetococcales bacterium]
MNIYTKTQQFKYLFVASLFMVATLLTANLGHSGKATLKTQPATNKNYLSELVLDGVVEAVNRATMTAEVAGQVVAVNFDVNDYVEKGQILIEIKGKKRKANLSVAKSALLEAQAGYKQAKGEYSRHVKLFEKKLIAAKKMEQIKAAFTTAKARFTAAKAQVDSASETVANNIVRAPFSGYVLERFVHLGETAQIGQPLFSGMSLASLRLFVKVPQQSIIRVKRFNKARAIFGDSEELSLNKMTVFPYADEKTHSFGVRLPLPKNLKGFFPGMIVKVAFKVGYKKRLFIPVESVIHRSEVTGVYSVENGRINFRRVLVGRELDGEMVEVLSGLIEGEHVALDPVKAGQVRLQSLDKKITL